MFVLFVTVFISGVIHENEWKTYDRFEECWEAATLLVHNKPNMTARCVSTEHLKQQQQRKGNNAK